MSDSHDKEFDELFDQELSMAFQKDPALAGWEFTPAMQQQVLDRIQADEPQPARRSRFPAFRPVLPRPLVWTAVAAAAFLIVLRVGPDLGQVGSMKEEAGTQMASSAPMADDATKRVALDRAGSEEPKMNDAAPREATLKAADAPVAPDGPVSSLAAPDMAPTGDTGVQTFMVATAQTFTLLETARQADLTVGVMPDRVQGYDRQGGTVWEVPLPGAGPGSLLAVAPDGASAVSAGATLHLFSPSGVEQAVIDLPASPSALAFSRDGRLAVAGETGLRLYREGTELHRIGSITAQEMAFGPNGNLAVLGWLDSGLKLALYNPEGRRLLAVTPEHEAGGLIFGAGGNVLITGRTAYDLTGQVLWTAPDPDAAGGVIPMAESHLAVFWNNSGVQAYNSAEGRLLWEQSRPGLQRVAVSPDGSLLALLAPSESGFRLWVVNQQGRQIYTEQLPVMPEAVSFIDHRLLMVIDGKVQVRVIPE